MIITCIQHKHFTILNLLLKPCSDNQMFQLLFPHPVPQNSPKRATRKSIARDIAEPEDKPVTPARRSTRIKSNTSIVSETVQSFDSPRAKRAATRKNSQVGKYSK